MDGVSSVFNGRPEPIKAVQCFEVVRNPTLFFIALAPKFDRIRAATEFFTNDSNCTCNDAKFAYIVQSSFGATLQPTVSNSC